MKELKKLEFEFDTYEPFLIANQDGVYAVIWSGFELSISAQGERVNIPNKSLYDALEKANQWYNDYLQLKDILNTTNRKI